MKFNFRIIAIHVCFVYLFCMHIFIVQHIDLDFRSMRYKKSILLLTWISAQRLTKYGYFSSRPIIQLTADVVFEPDIINLDEKRCSLKDGTSVVWYDQR